MPFADPDEKRACDAAYYKANKEKIKARASTYYASKIELGRSARREYRSRNLERLRQYDADRYAANPANWKRRSAHRKALVRGAEGTYTAADIDRIAASQRNRCAYCQDKLTKKNRHVDHIKPLSKGGSNWPSNLQLLCAPCNLAKHAADPLDFARRIGRLL